MELEPAATVIRICGGIEPTAQRLGKHRTVINRWVRPKETGGTGGVVPMRDAQTLLDQGVPGLKPCHFFHSPHCLKG